MKIPSQLLNVIFDYLNAPKWNDDWDYELVNIEDHIGNDNDMLMIIMTYRCSQYLNYVFGVELYYNSIPPKYFIKTESTKNVKYYLEDIDKIRTHSKINGSVVYRIGRVYNKDIAAIDCKLISEQDIQTKLEIFK